MRRKRSKGSDQDGEDSHEAQEHQPLLYDRFMIPLLKHPHFRTDGTRNLFARLHVRPCSNPATLAVRMSASVGSGH